MKKFWSGVLLVVLAGAILTPTARSQESEKDAKAREAKLRTIRKPGTRKYRLPEKSAQPIGENVHRRFLGAVPIQRPRSKRGLRIARREGRPQFRRSDDIEFRQPQRYGVKPQVEQKERQELAQRPAQCARNPAVPALTPNLIRNDHRNCPGQYFDFDGSGANDFSCRPQR
jgi:hypothetical protein